MAPATSRRHASRMSDRMRLERRPRRTVLVEVAGGAVGLLLTWRAAAKEQAEEISPAEDLMREHGVLARVLLIYEEHVRRIEAAEPLPPAVLAPAAALVRRFIEDYHEKLEEDYLFPRFEQAGALSDLVSVLRAQHQAGRRLTETIQRLSDAAAAPEAERTKLAAALREFIRMYRPHAAREDTVLFPAFRSLLSAREYAALGETFEDREHALFGEHGFEAIVAEVARLERLAGIHDLAAFTPR